jgi:hypothetical protein
MPLFGFSSFFAARNVALLFGLGAMLGACKLVGRGFLSWVSSLSPFDVGLAMERAELERDMLGRPDATEAGRDECRGGLKDVWEVVREIPGVLLRDEARAIGRLVN